MSRSAFVDLDRRDLTRVLRVERTSRSSRSAAWASSTSSAPTRSRSSAMATAIAPTTPAGRAANRCRSTSPSAGDERRRRVTFEKLGPRPGAALHAGRAVRDQRPEDPAVRRDAGTCSTSPAASGSSSTVGPSRSTRSAWPPPPTASPGRSTAGTSSKAASRPTRRRRARTCSSPTARTTCSSAYRYSEHYRGKEYGYRIGYARSTDLVNWERDDTRAGIDVSEDGLGLGDGRATRTSSRSTDARTWPTSATRSAATASGSRELEGALSMRWRKLGRIFDPDDHTPADGCVDFAQSPQALVFDDFVRILLLDPSARRATGST